ncbi:hypothetical protein L7F22_008774 [Adiantum nelumboides]|nr:hypothetical protein [Adiantum nelumboides]
MAKDKEGKALFQIWCEECETPYGQGGPDTIYNYLNSHIKTIGHMRAMGLHDPLVQPRSSLGVGSTPEEETATKNKKCINDAMEEVRAFGEERNLVFDLVHESATDLKTLSKVYIQCILDGKWIPLFLNTLSIRQCMIKHVKSKSHIKATAPNPQEVIKKGGRPNKSTNLDNRQKDLTSFFKPISGSDDKAASASATGDGEAHSKQESIWTAMNHAHGQTLANLGNYTSVASDDDILRALREGFHEAKVVCENLDEEDTADISLGPLADVEEFNTCVDDEVTVAECELRHVMDSVVDDVEDIKCQISPFVEVDGKTIYKSTLVSQLNGNPTLYKDRLTRVKGGVYDTFDKKVTYQSRTCLVVGSDCAVLFERLPSKEIRRSKVKGKLGSTNEGMSKGTWYLGRVVCMRRKLGLSMKETRGPIDLLDRPANVEIHLAWYQKAKGTRSYTYDLIDNQCVPLESIISIANLTYDLETKKYQLDANDYKVFNEYIKGIHWSSFFSI